MALQKEITTKHLNTGNYWSVQSSQTNKVGTDGDKNYRINGNLSLFKDQAAYEAGATAMDNATFSYLLTPTEIASDTIAIVYTKITESIMTGEGEYATETNLLTCNAGQIGFQDAISV